MTKEIFVKNVIEYLQATEAQKAVLFRGVSDKGYSLLPSIGRNFQKNADLTGIEKLFLEKFKDEIIFFNDLVPKSDWDYLMIAQHYGMQTRLLDWTANPLVALYFASENDYEQDGAVYRLGDMARLTPVASIDPFSITKDYIIKAPHLSPRIAAQSAYFTISNNPRLSFHLSSDYQASSGHYDKIIIPYDKKIEILRELNHYGIHAAALFPGLDGVSKKLNFELSDIKGILDKTP